jgi:hypothetical protein
VRQQNATKLAEMREGLQSDKRRVSVEMRVLISGHVGRMLACVALQGACGDAGDRVAG